MIDFSTRSLARRFLIMSFPVMFIGMLAVGFWVAREIERGVVNRLGAVTSLYVESAVAPHLQQLLGPAPDLAQGRRALDALVAETTLGRRIVAFNIWRADGRLLYSTNREAAGRDYPVGEGLATALAGGVYSKIVERPAIEHGFLPGPGPWPARVIETYAPVHGATGEAVIGAAEFYQATGELERETARSQATSWLVVGASVLAMYLALFGLVRRGSQTIDDQRRALDGKVGELSALLERNARLDARVRGAAARATALNERFLRRLSRDLHDGPGQDLGLALMRVESVRDRLQAANGAPRAADDFTGEVAAIRRALESALTELRSISAGLQLPRLRELSAAETARRAVRDFEWKSGATVALAIVGDAAAALPVKITLYRLLQEALANAFRHGGGVDLSVALSCRADSLEVAVSDGGRGFDAPAAAAGERLGLAGMRERVAALGGRFELQTAPGRGTRVGATLPLGVPGDADD